MINAWHSSECRERIHHVNSQIKPTCEERPPPHRPRAPGARSGANAGGMGTREEESLVCVKYMGLMGWDGMEWDGMEWDGMDGIGYNGVGWDGME